MSRELLVAWAAWLGIIFVVWGLHSIIANVKKELLGESKKK